MRKVHLISVTEPLLFDLALAIHQKGYEVSVSGVGLTDTTLARLEKEGCTCHGDGWFPERLTKDIHFVVLGAAVRQDNPELIRAKELGLLVLSIPEFIFQRTKEKTRVVVAGSRGKKTIISMIVCALKRQKLAFDYALTSEVPLLPDRVHLSYEARIAIIEGDEHVTSALEKRFQLEFYRPHIAILTNLMWTSATDHATPEAYHTTFRTFASSIERGGKADLFRRRSGCQTACARGSRRHYSHALRPACRGRERGKDLFADSLRGLSRLYSGSLFPDQPECCPPGLPPVRCKRCGFLSGIIRI